MTVPDEIARAERARLDMLDAVYAGIQRLLGLTEEHAQAVLDLQFGRLTRSSVTRIERDRENLRAEWG